MKTNASVQRMWIFAECVVQVEINRYHTFAGSGFPENKGAS